MNKNHTTDSKPQNYSSPHRYIEVTDLAAQPEVQAALMDTMGRVYGNLGLYSTASRIVLWNFIWTGESRQKLQSISRGDSAALTVDYPELYLCSLFISP
jgi:hypothetical protein